MDSLLQYLATRSPFDLARDALDLLITYYIFYRVALVLRGTRAIQVVFGLALVFVLYLGSQLLQLTTVLTLLSAVLSSAILIGVVVFQNDIRRGLMRVGARARFGSAQSLESKVIDSVVAAATILARHRTGAIITFEQDADLDEFVGSNTGHVIDAAVTEELLVSLFIPEAMNKLHDGAVVLRDLRIAKAGVFFPMPQGRVTDDSFGSRHRAAMGITEETDAVVVVVSEERGSISFCFNGNIIPNLDGPKLKAALEGVFVPKRKPRKVSWWARLARRPEPLPTAKTEISPAALKAKAKAKTEETATTQEAPTTLAEETPPPLRRKKEGEEPRSESQPPAPLRKKKTAEEGDEKAASPAPLRKKKPDEEGEPDSAPPKPLRKKRKPSDGTRPESNPPPPLRKKLAASGPESGRPSSPPPSSTLVTPLRHMSPTKGAEGDGPLSLRQPAKPAEFDALTEESDAPSSARHPGSRPMPRAPEVGASGDDRERGDTT